MLALGKKTAPDEQTRNLEAVWSSYPERKGEAMPVLVDCVIFDDYREIPVGALEGER